MLFESCTNSQEKEHLSIRSESVESNSSYQKQIEDFKYEFKNIQNELYDSVKGYQTDGIDFSDITTGLERKYTECKNETEKILLGYELARNYFLCFQNSDKIIYKQKADSLFYSFVSYKHGEFASIYMELDINEVQFIENEWNNISEQDKDTLLFYGLLRGFNKGLPKSIK